jgi:hypothetical protein
MFKRFAAAILCSALSAACHAQTSTPAPASGTRQVCKNWTAVHRSGVLTVKGTCTVLVQAVVSITAAVPQGINPKILLLNLNIKEPVGMHSNAIGPKLVSFRKRTTRKYKSVSIDGSTDVPVSNR